MNAKNSIIIITVLLCFQLKAVTLVYNMKVRRVFNIEPVLERMKSRLVLSAVPIVFLRKRHLIDTRTSLNNREKRRVGGSLFNLRYVISSIGGWRQQPALKLIMAPSPERMRFMLHGLVLMIWFLPAGIATLLESEGNALSTGLRDSLREEK